MLFDLQSPRRKMFIRVIYSFLAILIGGGLILGTFGSGGGGLLDSLGLSDGSSSSDPFKDQIDDAAKAAAAAPNDPAKQLEVVRIRTQSAKANTELDENGNPVGSSDVSEQYSQAGDAWAKYIKLLGDKGKPDPGAALLMANGFFYLAATSSDADTADSNIKNAAEAQKVAAEGLPEGNGNTFFTLAYYSYFAGKDKQAKEAADKVLKIAGAQAPQLKKTFKSMADQAAQFRKSVKEASKPQGAQGAPGAPGAPQSNPFDNSLGGGLGGSGLGG